MFEILTVLNTIVIGVMIIAIITTGKEDKLTQEFDSWWESRPDEAEKALKGQNTTESKGRPKGSKNRPNNDKIAFTALEEAKKAKIAAREAKSGVSKTRS